MIEFIATIADNFSDWGPRLFEASRNTLALTLSGFVFAFLFGLLLEFARTRQHLLPRHAAESAILILRGVPILVVLYLLYFALPGVGIRFGSFTAGVVGLGLVHGAFIAEVLRAGLQSVPRGQWDSALSVGLSPFKAFRLVIFPQAFRIVLPPILVAMIALLKDSSICALIAVNELTLASRAIMSETFLPLHVFVLTGLFYFSLAWPASLGVKVLERHLRSRTRAGKPAGRRNLTGETDTASSTGSERISSQA